MSPLNLLTVPEHSSDRHKHFGRFEAVLIAPGSGSMLERLIAAEATTVTEG